MTRKDIICMAQETGVTAERVRDLVNFASLVASAEREAVLQLIKELRPAVLPLEGMGRGKATQEWFDILVKHIEEMKK